VSLPREVIALSGMASGVSPLASAAVRGGAFVFVSGLTAADPATGAPFRDTTARETRRILENLTLILEAAGSSLDRVVKVNVLVASMLEAPNMNEVYARFFPEPPPARTVCGARLPDGAKVMIECTALGAMATDRLQRSTIEPRNPVLNVSRSANLPHVPGVRIGDYLFLSGMGPIDPVTGERRHGPIAEQVRTTLANMKHLLESAGSSLERVVRVHVVLADIAHMAEMDRVYRELFPVDPPARTAWAMQLRFGNGCEIECVALA
jgi:2-iminobutanoate/2-iminopropanoate deaminase